MLVEEMAFQMGISTINLKNELGMCEDYGVALNEKIGRYGFSSCRDRAEGLVRWGVTTLKKALKVEMGFRVYA
jgi:hypothetical protein